jgi:putative SOS response-associated peptidase YedK
VRDPGVVCGRFSLYTSPERVARILDAQLALGVESDWRPSWNIPPTRRILGVTQDGDDRVIRRYKWGLLPSWAKDPSLANHTFNARGETVATKPMFRSAFKHRRLLIPADSFFEWAGTGRGKQPHLFRRVDGALLTFAGLWETWKDPRSEDTEVRNCTIITTEAGPDMEGIHERMPVILEGDTWERWLDVDVDDSDELEGMLHPPPAGTLEHYPVSRTVGSVGNDSPELVERVE